MEAITLTWSNANFQMTFDDRGNTAGPLADRKGQPIVERLTNDEMRRARRITGLSSPELARRLGVRSDTLRRWETGRDPIPYRVREEMVAIAEERAATIQAAARALEDAVPLPLTPETVIASKGWRGSLQEVQNWLWEEENAAAEEELIERLNGADLLDALPGLTFEDVKDVLGDPEAKLIG